MITYSKTDLVRYFLYLGSTGFGGPVALVGLMHKHLVEEKKWISEDDFKEGLALSQLAPGPLAAQLGIYIGYVHYGWIGATLAGAAFVLPSFLMVLAIGYAYIAFGGLPWMQSLFYGVGAAVVGLIAVSCIKLTKKSVGEFSLSSLRKNALLWLFFVSCAGYTWYYEKEDILLFLGMAVFYMFYRSSLLRIGIRSNFFLGLITLGTGLFTADPELLRSIGLFFTHAGAFVFGSGLAIVPFLHAGVVHEYRWLTEQQFLDAVAVAMITPGPVVITVGFIGFLVAGFPGATVAALGTFFPCYLFTVIPAPYFRKIASNVYVKSFVDGITACVVGALVGSVLVIAGRSVVDVTTALMAGSAALLIWYNKLSEPLIILGAAACGLLVKTSLVY
jgi:chromate transporter